MERNYTVDELFGAVKRRWKWAAIVAGAVFALSALVIARLPNEYRARAMVMVEDTHPHPDLISPVIQATLEDRVKSVRAQVYARGLMAMAVQEMNLYPKLLEKEGMDGAVEQLRLDTEVHAEGDTAFSITVRSRDAAQAAQTANRIAELFIEENLQVRNGQVTRTRDIISAKLADLRGQLDGQESKVQSFKQAHRDELPELIESRIHEREALNKRIELEDGFLKDSQRRLDLIGTLPYGKDTEVGRLEEKVDELRAKAGSASATLTDDNPDVQSLKRELSAANGRLQAARTRAAQNDLEQKRISSMIVQGRKAVDKYEARIEALDKVVAGSPLVGSQLTEMQRDLDLTRAKVGSLISKKAESELAADLEAKSAASEFRVLETATAATLPSSPNRPQALLLALLAALALGAAVAVGQELADRTLRSESEAIDVQLPVLASVPKIGGAGRAARLLTLNAGNSA